MKNRQEPDIRHGRARTARRLALALAVVVAVVALVVMVGGVELLKPNGAEGKLGDLNDKIDQVRGPAISAFAALSGLGLLAGGAMAALGMPQGIRMMTLSGLSGGGVVLGLALIQ
jgi:hypothetical protein